MAAEANSQAATREKPAEEKQTNCPACNKPLKRIKRYYRNNKFYCTKKCWAKIAKAKEAPKNE